jgi:hypothetical protein
MRGTSNPLVGTVATDPAVTLSGYVDEIVVENRVSGVEQRYPS